MKAVPILLGTVIFPASDRFGVIRPQRLPENGQRPPEQRLRQRRLPLRLVKHGQIVERHSGIGMPGSKNLLFQPKRALVERLGLKRVTGCVPQGCQVVQIDGDLVMLRAIDALEYAQRTPIELFRLLVFFCPSRIAANAATSAATST